VEAMHRLPTIRDSVAIRIDIDRHGNPGRWRRGYPCERIVPRGIVADPLNGSSRAIGEWGPRTFVPVIDAIDQEIGDKSGVGCRRQLRNVRSRQLEAAFSVRKG